MAKNKKDSMAYMVDPSMAAIGMPMQPQQGLTYQPPPQANQMGMAQPVFNQQTQGIAAGAFGTPAMMQKSVGVAYMTESQEEAFGPGGHSENPGLYKQLK
jgi:hypothetical protein